jgi:hypothetical protein
MRHAIDGGVRDGFPGFGVEQVASEVVQRRQRRFALFAGRDVATADERRAVADRDAFDVDQQRVLGARLVDRDAFDVREHAPFFERVGVEEVRTQQLVDGPHRLDFLDRVAEDEADVQADVSKGTVVGDEHGLGHVIEGYSVQPLGAPEVALQFGALGFSRWWQSRHDGSRESLSVYLVIDLGAART